MSYNIDSVETVYSKDFEIGPTFEEMAAKYADAAPEISVFRDDWNIRYGFAWSGIGSGMRAAQEALPEVLSSFNGEVDLILTWEGGDSFSGLRLRNHKVTKHDVVMTLGKEKV